LAMLVVSLLPLALFAVLVGVDVGSVSRATVDSANRAILDDAERGQQAQLASRAQSVATVLDSASAQLRALRDRIAAALHGAAGRSPPAPASRSRVALPPYSVLGDIAYTTDDRPPGSAVGSTVMVGSAPSVSSLERSPLVATAWRDTAAVEPAMETVRA